MIGIDTNVLVRFLVRDDEAQFERARRLIKREVGRGEPVFISQLVLLETEWVLRSRYAAAKPVIVAALSALLEARELQFEDEPSVEEAIFIWKDSSAEFADCLINAHHRALGCRATATFDAKALKLAGFVAA
jgi:predicted nucleic-acid-binding protein